MQRCLSFLPGWLCWTLAVSTLQATALTTATNAPVRYTARYWQTDKGLPHNSVYAVCQAPDGYLWVATDGGLVCFDGFRFKPTPFDDLLGDAHDLVRHLELDNRGVMWIGTSDGRLAQIRDGIFSWVTPPGASLGQPIVSMDRGSDGSFWVGLSGAKLIQIKDGVIRSNLPPPKAALPGTTQVAVDRRNGRVWFSSGRNWGYLDQGRFQLQTPALETNAPIRLLASASGGLWRISDQRLHRSAEGSEWTDLGPLPKGLKQIKLCYEDQKGRLWCGTAGEVLYFFKDGRWERVVGLPHAILTLTEDSEGHIWAGTDGSGLVRLRPRSYRLINPIGGSSRQPVRSVCEDRDGEIWWTSSGRHLSLLHQGEEYIFPTKDFLPFIRVIHPHPGGGIWVGTSAGVYHVRHLGQTNWSSERVINVGIINALLMDSKGALWAGSTQHLIQWTKGKVRRYSAPLEGAGDAIQVLAQDLAGRIWIGTRKGTLHSYDGVRFTHDDTSSGLSGHRIQAILPNLDGTLWLGTVGGGLVHFKEGRATRITAAMGLPADAIAQILRGVQDDLWLGGSRGLFRVREQDLLACVDGRQTRLNPITYGRNEGLPSLNAADWAQPSTWISRSGEYLFATTAGLVGVDVNRASTTDSSVVVRLEEVLAAGRTWAPTDKLVLPADSRQVTLRFTALGFGQAELINFRHRLVGADQDWIETGGQREARYTQVPAGTYRFEVQASNNDGVWQTPGASFTLVVSPFLWEKRWFTVLSLLGLVSTGAVAFRQWSTRRLKQRLELLKRQQEVLKERERIARDIHDEIGAGLTNISLLGELALRGRHSPRDLQGELSRMTERARDMVRALDEIVWAVNPRNDTFNALITYLCHYAQETLQAAGIRCRLDVPDDVPPLPLSAEFRHHIFLILKEALNNICKHSSATEVELTVVYDRDRIELRIHDNGLGFEAAQLASNRSGLSNMRARASLLGGTFHVESRRGSTTICLVTSVTPQTQPAV
jgi:signal transduction histidine kinase/ligand-binding sensor domain-containing protein